MKLPTTPSFALNGRQALVTGASKGLGLAAACALAQAGARVTLVARSAQPLDEVVQTLQHAGLDAEALALDIRDQKSVERALAKRTFNILVNNAGTNRPKLLAENTVEDYEAIMGLNVQASYFLSQQVIENMPGGGSVINMSSQMGHVGARKRTLYCTSKSAVEGMTRAMAVELGERDIRVNSICPTYIETPLTEPYFRDPDFRKEVLANIPLGRIGQVEDVMGAVVFLASPASALITGSSLMVDGGWTAH